MTALPRPPFRQVASAAFLASLLAVPLASRLLRPAPRPPETLAELSEALRRFCPALHVVPANGRDPQSGIYISDRPLLPGRIAELLRQPERADGWESVVYCEHDLAVSQIGPPDLAGWGEHGMRAGPLLFFGDPRLLADLAPLVGGEGLGR
jgi:hypothetical protein